MKKLSFILSVILMVSTFSITTNAQVDVLNNDNAIVPIGEETAANYENTNVKSETPGIVSGTVYYIKNVGSGKYLNVHYGVDANGTNVYQWTKDNSTEQKFKVVYSSGDNAYRIYAMCSSNGTNRVLDIVRNGASVSAGQNVDIWTPVDDVAQKWYINTDETGNFRITSVGNITVCLSALGNNNGTANGTTASSSGNVIVATQTRDSAYQNWIFEPVAGGTTAVAPTGHLDVVSNTIAGWAWRADIPYLSIDVHIYVINTATNQQYIFVTTANQYRSDLENAGYGNGYHGFVYTIDWNSLPIGSYAVYAYGIGVDGNNPLLSNCPKYYDNVRVELHQNAINEGVTWVLLFDSVVTGVGYRVDSVCNVVTETFTQRIAVEASSYASAEENPSPEINLPDISIGHIKINNTQLTLQEDNNMITAPNVIWTKKVAYPNLSATANSQFESLIICMLNGALYPYQDFTNTFVF